MCARCTGLYFGVSLGLAVALVFRRRMQTVPRMWLLAGLVGAASINGAQVAFEALGQLPSGAGLRLALGAYFGVSLGALVSPRLVTRKGLRALPFVVLGLGSASLAMSSSSGFNQSGSIAAITAVASVIALLLPPSTKKDDP